MKNFHLYWFKEIVANNVKLERRLSLGEYRRAVSWSKYLVSSGAEIKGEGEEEWSADMSELYIGNKFASGRHSRIYRGIYKQRDVAIKLISQPEEDGDLALFLEKQFTSEVSLLLRLKHPNIITVSFYHHSHLFSVSFLPFFSPLILSINRFIFLILAGIYKTMLLVNLFLIVFLNKAFKGTSCEQLCNNFWDNFQVHSYKSKDIVW